MTGHQAGCSLAVFKPGGKCPSNCSTCGTSSSLPVCFGCVGHTLSFISKLLKSKSETM